jgi:hypothetical protein
MTASAAPAVRVFVAAPHDTALRPLLEGLRRAGLDAFVFSDVAPLGTDLVESARTAVDAADLVLVVLTKRPALDPIFEAGMAAALGKRLLLIREPDAGVPVDLASFVVVEATLDDPAPVVAAVQEVARRPLSPDRPPPKATGHALDSSTAARLRERLDAGAVDERTAMEVLIEAINATGGVAVESSYPDQGWDIGVWSDDLAAIGGNPLLIEIKRQLIPTAVDQMRHYLAAQHAVGLGLVVYIVEPSDEAVQRAVPGAWFPVLVISLRELVRQLSSQSFARVIRNLRNRAVHGWPRG